MPHVAGARCTGTGVAGHHSPYRGGVWRTRGRRGAQLVVARRRQPRGDLWPGKRVIRHQHMIAAHRSGRHPPCRPAQSEKRTTLPRCGLGLAADPGLLPGLLEPLAGQPDPALTARLASLCNRRWADDGVRLIYRYAANCAVRGYGPGHSVEMLLRVHAKCLDGQDEIARRRIVAALGDIK